MYDFIDTIETLEGGSLPSEALQLNGEFIENQIAGYRTLTVTGREALSPEVTTYETGIRDGSIMKGKRYPARIIRITYQLVAASNEAFREAYNKLAGILNVKDAELIFNDETDKYYIGTPAAIGEVEPGRNAIVGEFEILCLDPFKYSVIEYEAVPELDESSILLDYNGTYKSYPKLYAEFYKEDESSEDGETVTELEGAGDCGYVAFFNEDKKIIQLGDPEEVDGKTVAASQTLVNQSFNTSTSWGTAARSLWSMNSGIATSDAMVQTGSLGMKVASYATPPLPAADRERTLLTTVSKAGSPYIHYSVTAKSFNRKADSVDVTVMISARLDNSKSWFGIGYDLYASVYINGAWKLVKLKDKKDYWIGTSSHKRSFTVTIGGLKAITTLISGIKFKAGRKDGTGGTAGIVSPTACNNLAIDAYATPTAATYHLAPQSYGTGSGWHGPTITRTIPANAVNFTLTYSQNMCIGADSAAAKQVGGFLALLVNGSGANRKIVAGVYIYKTGNGKKGKLRLYVNDKVTTTVDVDLSNNNKNFKSPKASTITKSGATVTFNICGIVKTYVCADVADLAATEVTFRFTQYGTNPALFHNGLCWAKFVKHSSTWKDSPNKFSANDIVEANCKTGEIFLNGVPASIYGALGNDWEEFYLKPGLNQIGFSYSDWVGIDYAPTFKLKYREVFL